MACKAYGGMSPLSSEDELDDVKPFKCIMHLDPATTIPCKQLTEKRWETFRRCARDWSKTRAGSVESDIVRACLPFLDESWSDIPSNFGFHPICYCRFTDKKRINSALKRAEKPRTMKRLPSTVSPKKEAPQKRKMLGYSLIMGYSCLICQKFHKFLTRKFKRVQDKLSLAKTESAGLLYEAAEVKRDERILNHIRGKDCAAIEVRYHQSCYRQYTRLLSWKEKETKGFKSTKERYIHSYHTFCDEVVRGRIINGQEIIRMKDLLDLFVKTVQKEEAITLEDFRADQLKYYLRQDFPQLHFHKSPKRNTSEMVFSGFLGASDGLEQTPCGPTSSTESSNSEQKTESGENVPDGRDIPGHVHREYTQAFYSLIVHQSGHDSGMAAPWPPTSAPWPPTSAPWPPTSGFTGDEADGDDGEIYSVMIG